MYNIMIILEFIVWCICLWIIIGKDSVWIILYISGILSLFILIFIINIICKIVCFRKVGFVLYMFSKMILVMMNFKDFE